MQHWVELLDERMLDGPCGAFAMSVAQAGEGRWLQRQRVPALPVHCHTRWQDNDMYGHVNNVVYYAYFDTVVNEHLIRVAGISTCTRVPKWASWRKRVCVFRASLIVSGSHRRGACGAHAGTHVSHLRHRAFRAARTRMPAALGHFVHVWVDRATRRPVPVPDGVRDALQPLLRGGRSAMTSARTFVIVPAAGSGERYGAAVPQAICIAGRAGH